MTVEVTAALSGEVGTYLNMPGLFQETVNQSNLLMYNDKSTCILCKQKQTQACIVLVRK